MPTLASSQTVASAAADTSSLVSASITWAAGNVIVVKAVSGADLAVSGVTATGLTFTSRASYAGSGAAFSCSASVWTATAAAAGSGTVTAAFSGVGGVYHAACFERWTSAQLAAPPASVAAQGADPVSTTLTTVAANSTVTWANGDYNAQAPTAPAYRSSATQEGIDNKSPGTYVAYFAWQPAAAAGSQTVGMTAPLNQAWTIVGVEVKDASASTAAATLVHPKPTPRAAVLRASTF